MTYVSRIYDCAIGRNTADRTEQTIWSSLGANISVLSLYQPASEMPFRWHFAGWPIVALREYAGWERRNSKAIKSLDQKIHV